MYVAFAVSVPVDCEPLVARVPDQPPDALQEVVLVDDQDRVEVPPLAMVLGLALKLTVGAGDLTDTVADCAALPPAPVQVRVYVAFAVSAPVDCEPLSALPPDQAPEATHAVAEVEDQLSVALAPLLMALGPTLKLTVGSDALTDTVVDCDAFPPGPTQTRTYVALFASAPVDCVPLVTLAPDQASEAVQEVALSEDHFRVELPPDATVLGLAPRLIVGAGEVTDTVAD